MNIDLVSIILGAIFGFGIGTLFGFAIGLTLYSRTTKDIMSKVNTMLRKRGG